MMLATYATYLLVSLGITFWVGRSLNQGGRIFLVENFEGKAALADSVNHLLLVGFYLVNIGFVAVALRFGDKPADLVGVVEFLSTKIGLAVLVLGLMHLANVRLLMRFRTSDLFRAATAAPAGPAGR